MSEANDLCRIKLLLFDVDGILTDGSLYVGEGGDLLKRFHIHDGAGLVMARRAGLLVGLLSGHDSNATKRRAASLGIDICHVGVKDKVAVLNEILQETGLSLNECLFMGDDLQDLPVLSRVGYSVSVPNARKDVRSRVDLVTDARGGEGAVREVVELCLRAKGLWDASIGEFLS